MRIVRRALLILFIVLAVVVAAGAIYANSSAARRHVRAVILRELNETWGIPTQFDDLEVRFFPFTVRIFGLRISHPTEGPFLEARELTITPDTWSLLRGRYRLEEVALVEPRVHLKVRDGRVVNVPEPRRPPGSTEEPPLIDAFALVDGAVDADIDFGGGPPLSVALSGLNLDLTGDRNELFELRALAAGGTVRWGGFVRAVRRFEARVGMTPAEVRVRRFSLALGEDVTLDVSRGQVELAARPAVQILARAALPLDVLGLLPEWLGLPDLGGDLEVGGAVRCGPPEGAAEGWACGSTLEAGVRRARAGETFVGDLAGGVDVGTAGIDLRALAVDTGIGKLRIDGSLRFAETLPFAGTVRMERLEFAPLLERFGVPRSKVVQTFDGAATVRGTGDPFLLRAEVDTDVADFATYDESFRFDSKMTVLAVPQAHVTGGIECDAEKLTIVPTEVRHGSSRHTVTGTYRYADARFTLDIASDPLVAADIARLLEIGIAGTGPTHTLIDGPIGDPTITAEMSLRDFRYLELAFGNVRATLRYSGLLLEFPEIHAATGESRYDVLGLAFDMRDPRPGRWTATADIRANPIRLRDVPAVLQGHEADFADYEASVEGSAKLAYRSWTDDFDVAFDVRARHAVVRGEPVDLVAAAGRYARGAVQLPRVRLERLGGWVEGSATVSDRGHVRADLRGEGIPIHRILGGRVGELGLEAKAAVQAQLEGTRETLAGRAEVSLAGATFRGRDLGPVDLQVFLEEGRRVRAIGRAGTGGLRFDVLADLEPHLRLGVTADFAGLEPLPFLRDARLGPYRLVVSGRTALAVDVGRETRVDGKADLSALELTAPQGTVRAVEPVWLAFTESGVDVRRGRFELPGRSLVTVLGHAGTDRVDIDVQGGADVATVLALFEGAPAAEGRVDFGARVTGTFEEPQLVGTVRLAGGRLPLGEEYGALERVEAELTLTPSRISIDRLSGEVLGGHVRAAGAVALERFRPAAYDADVDFGGMTYELSPTLPVGFDGTVHVSGDRAGRFRPLVTGDVYVTRLQYTDPVRLGATLSDLGRSEVEAVPTFRPEDDFVRFDVRLHGEGLGVRNNLLEAAFHIDDASQPFRVVGTNQLYGVVGAVVIDHGQIRFRRSTFDVTRGVVTFDSPWKIDPRFDVVAETEVRDWRITLTASGRRDDLRLMTTADPDLPEEDIVLLLTIGMTREEAELLGATGAVGGALAEVFDEALGVSERFGRYMPLLDQMRITTEYSTRTGRSEPRIAFGKRLSDQARIEASSSLTDTRDFRAVFSYEVTDRFSIEGVYDNNNDQQFGNVGADVRWRIDF